MILSGQDIRRRGMIVPFREKYTFELSGGGIISGGLSTASYDIALDQELKISGHGFVLASSVEYFNMPIDVAAVNHDKSTWARRGIAVQNTYTDPGFGGYLTLEISNNTDVGIIFDKGTPIAQVVFHLLTSPAENPYEGKYQNQSRGPQKAK